MLVIKRKTSETFTIQPVEGVDLTQTLNDLFASGSIEVRLLEVGKNQVKLAIAAPPQLKIWRGQGPLAETRKSPADSAYREMPVMIED